jgi:signal transduction histidine kinase
VYTEEVSIADNTTATHLYRIAQEAIQNTLRHAHAERAEIGLERVDGRISMTVRDDGTGIDSDAPEREGMGLRTMHYRAKEIGATLNVERASGGGTVVKCTLHSITSQ